MAPVFPIDEIEQRLQVEYRPPLAFHFPIENPAQFSVHLASRLVDLCAHAQSLANPWQAVAQDDQLFIAFHSHADPAAIFNFRGLTQPAVEPFTTGRVYGPLLHAYQESVAPLLAELPSGKHLWLTGHGIAAAYALLAAADLTRQSKSVSAVYTFASPRIGDAAFSRHFPCPVFRVVNNLDLMPTLPPLWKWRHTGAQKLINANGTLNQIPNPVNRLPSLAQQTLWLGEMLAEGLTSGFPRPLYSLLKQVITDHAVSSYAARLRVLSNSA